MAGIFGISFPFQVLCKQAQELNHYQAAVTLHTRKLPLMGKTICGGLAAGTVATLYRLLLMGEESLKNHIQACSRP